jgi:peroxiredoxin
MSATGFLELHDAIKAKGVDTIACLATNDHYVMQAWGKDLSAHDKILFLSDGDFKFTKDFGLAKEGGGDFVRTRRMSMLVSCLLPRCDMSGAYEDSC